jgi:2-amino-4-hydroxy-6-hydroxymethyldihydropteridine diphosphokinase
MTTFVALSIGSNLGDRETGIASMEHELCLILSDVRVSALMETAPVGVFEPQPPYLNKIVTGYYSGGGPYRLLDACFDIESRLGRTRSGPKSARFADVDILIFGHWEVNDGTLVIPHPQILNRRFCLEGLAQIDPEIVIPLADGNRTVGSLCKKMSTDVAAQSILFI